MDYCLISNISQATKTTKDSLIQCTHMKICNYLKNIYLKPLNNRVNRIKTKIPFNNVTIFERTEELLSVEKPNPIPLIFRPNFLDYENYISAKITFFIVEISDTILPTSMVNLSERSKWFGTDIFPR
ncbi:hypothetical protein BpHYR1_050191 [Brachionus plicatilis]|uniref:Uncharacterized protein n=1 Tax=Brachionus plicatilis TaxID=10195 RepID=A0A3M7QZS2_BRAPC|nr:hypothetical protein BpHYR1_050191 [Brachionus plicatilis]